MSPENFVYWLRGFIEISHECEPDAEQWQMIKEHLDLVMTKVTPNHNVIVKLGPDHKITPDHGSPVLPTQVKPLKVTPLEVDDSKVRPLTPEEDIESWLQEWIKRQPKLWENSRDWVKTYKPDDFIC